MRLFTAVVCLFVLLGGCSDDDGGSSEPGGDQQEEGGWLEQWAGDGFTEGTYEGEPVLIDEDQRVLYIADCDLAREATGSGGVYGPKDGERGYGSVCPS